ncbi:hypothetical protein RQP46_003084 [Phenoliferia psychrophenolica]
MDDTNALPDYKIGERLGSGAFGSVYKAFNWTSGETVAIKQIGLSNIPKSELPDIMSEIDLLKNLHHPNIVQYRGFVKTSDFLYIILEYCENGSLQTVTKKFGRFPESLVALYILQVLQGLLYLHDQGVIHRDIKGSNILATKEGSIKLADFGVATRAGGPADSAVVGSPYWMAPEVVDQTGATTASDIWSLGALVIELITGKPPYHFLDPMPALFRIVNDDCPPIPDTASAVVRDFLLQCFQKDGNLRIGARKLLRHPWMMAAKRQADQTKRDQIPKAARPISGYDDTVQRVQEWNEALNAAPTAPRPRLSDDHRILRRPSAELASALQAPPPPPPSDPDVRPAKKSSARPSSTGSSTGVPLALPAAVTRRESVPDAHEEDQDEAEDNWDLDFEEGISSSKLAALDRDGSSNEEESDGNGSDEDDDFQDANSHTIRPSTASSASLPVPMVPIVEDYSDLVGDDEADPFEGRVASLMKFNTQKKRILHPKDISDSFLAASPSSTINILANRDQPSSLSRASSIPLPPTPTLSAPQPPPPPQLHLPTKFVPHHRATSSSGKSIIEQYSELDSEDYSDVFGKTAIDQFSSNLEALQLNTKLSSKSWVSLSPPLPIQPQAADFIITMTKLGDEDSDEEDPFAEVEDEDGFDDDADLETNVARDKLARLASYVGELVDAISSDTDEYSLREASLELINVFEDSPEIKSHFIKCHGLLAVIEVLQLTRSREILAILLRVLNLLVGGGPVVMAFASNKYSREIRLEAALFICAMCRTSLLTIQMFVSCRGLKTLVEMMDENYAERKDLVWMAVDGISRVFELHGSTPRNDYCRIFTTEGLLEPLSSALLQVAKDDDDLAESAKAKIIHILLIFAQSERKVKEAMSTRTVVLRLVKALAMLEPDLLAPMLKTIKTLTMLPSALDVLQNANAIEALVLILSEQFDGKLAAEIQNHVVNSLFNLCRLSKNRQEEAAVAGAIPILQRVVQGNSPLKQFALPILCDFAHASKTCRKILWQHDGLPFYLGLLKDPFWANPALDAIVSWLQDETSRVEDCLLEPTAVDALLRAFCRSKSTTFENLLEPFHKLLRTSTAVASKLAVQSAFFKRIIDRLSRGGKAVVRLNLLRITKTVFDSLSDRREKVIKIPNLVTTVAALAQDDPAILVKEMAKELSKEFVRTRDEAGNAAKRSLVSRVLRRTQSGEGPSSSASEGRSPSSSLRRSGTLFGRA